MMSDEDLELIASGFTAILGFKVVHGPAGEGLPKLTIHNLFHCTYVPRSLEDTSSEVFEIHVKTITGATITVLVTGAHTIAHVKAAVEVQENIPATDQRLMFDNRPLEDHQTISSLKVPPGATIYLLVRARGGPESAADFQLDPNELAPDHSFDFTNMNDQGRTYMRGGKPYKRPCGWNRVGIKVLDKYESNTWLGPFGYRVNDAPGEWPVSYLGTNIQSARAIMKTGFKFKSGDKVGKAVYSSPSLDMVERHYATKFEFKGNSWKIVLQNRVNPDPNHLTIIPAQDTGVGAEYWLSPKQDVDKGVYDVRPYGILFKKL